MLVTHAACCTCCFLYYLHCRLYKIILACYLYVILFYFEAKNIIFRFLPIPKLEII